MNEHREPRDCGWGMIEYPYEHVENKTYLMNMSDRFSSHGRELNKITDLSIESMCISVDPNRERCKATEMAH